MQGSVSCVRRYDTIKGGSRRAEKSLKVSCVRRYDTRADILLIVSSSLKEFGFTVSSRRPAVIESFCAAAQKDDAGYEE